MRWTVARHKVYSGHGGRTACGRTYAAGHTSISVTLDDSRVTCGNCRRSLRKIAREEKDAMPMKNVTPR
jgi:hypothetical protein